MNQHAEELDSKSFDQRNREIGEILSAARHRQQRTVTVCATAAHTTRRRYSMIERGDASISAAELEAIMRFLNVSAVEMWQELWTSTLPTPIIVKAPPGGAFQLVVEVHQ